METAGARRMGRFGRRPHHRGDFQVRGDRAGSEDPADESAEADQAEPKEDASAGAGAAKGECGGAALGVIESSARTIGKSGFWVIRTAPRP